MVRFMCSSFTGALELKATGGKSQHSQSLRGSGS